jgi:hypothetical protein
LLSDAVLPDVKPVVPDMAEHFAGDLILQRELVGQPVLVQGNGKVKEEDNSTYESIFRGKRKKGLKPLNQGRRSEGEERADKEREDLSLLEHAARKRCLPDDHDVLIDELHPSEKHLKL